MPIGWYCSSDRPICGAQPGWLKHLRLIVRGTIISIAGLAVGLGRRLVKWGWRLQADHDAVSAGHLLTSAHGGL